MTNQRCVVMGLAMCRLVKLVIFLFGGLLAIVRRILRVLMRDLEMVREGRDV
jgi:hypothetical protein